MNDLGDYLPRPFGAFSAMEESPVQLPSAEIAHAVLLPPPSADRALVRVLFICRTNCADVYDIEDQAGAVNRSFIWYPLSSPGSVQALDGPSSGYTGTADAFCSGHVTAADGSVIVVGGLDYVRKCFSTDDCITKPNEEEDPLPADLRLPVGHRVVYKLDTSVDPPEWVSDDDWPATTVREHWYPAVVAMHDEQILIAGHFGAPSPACPVPDWLYSEEDPFTIAQLFEAFDPAAPSSSEAYNLRYETTCSITQNWAVGVFPRLHLLSNQRLVHTNAAGDYVAHEAQPDTRFIDLTNQAPCYPTLVWEQAGNDPDVHRDGSSSLHYVVLDASATGGRRDLVYDIGGIEESDADPCASASPELYDSVQRFDGETMTWASRASLPVASVNHNAVILPTGTIIVPGGMQYDTTNGCQPILATREYYPDDFFDLPLVDEWKTRDTLDCPRMYHSVALLLPDGRVAVAGGVAAECAGGKNSRHTVEIFEPAYYSSGARPQITDWPKPDLDEVIENGDTDPFEIDVTLACASSNEVERVVLLRSGSVTHAFDMNQRYVELGFDPELTTGSYPNVTVQAQAPPAGGYAAPPGYYLLFVIDSNGLPSIGRWVKVVNP